MHLSPTADEVRQVVARVFRHYDEGPDIEERLRLEDGELVARCYRATELFAMWLVKVDLLQFYDSDGNMMHTINLRVMMSADRLAA